MSQVVRYMGQTVRGAPVDHSKARCPDPACQLLFGHSPWCSLDMSIAAMVPGAESVRIDKESGL